jgi:hypothetical protein
MLYLLRAPFTPFDISPLVAGILAFGLGQLSI